MNKTGSIQILARVFVVFFLYIVVYYVYTGITTNPSEGDSLAYHIPIAKTFLNGQFMRPKNILHFYPSASEAILALFLFLRIPLNLFNVLAIILLYFSVRKLGIVYGLQKDFSTIFAISVCCLNGIVRWISAQVIDIWLVVFFVMSLALLTKPEKNVRYFLSLGFVMGMLVGTKNTGPLFALVLVLFFGKNLITYLNGKRLLSFVIPFSILGLFWYVRDFILVRNPIYPQSFLLFTGAPHWNIFQWNVARIALSHPVSMVNALFGEYMMWSPVVILPIILLFYKRLSILHDISLKVMIAIGLINFCFFLFLPTVERYNIMVSSFRYSYPAFIPLILSFFIISQRYKKQEIISYLAFANLITLPSLSYHPKLLIFLLPLVFIFTIFDKKIASKF